jgi:hypothetical protein
MPLETFSTEGMNIDQVERSFSVLEAKFGAGYHAGVLVGHAGGLHLWTLSASLLPDNTNAESGPMTGVARFAYYWNFYQARMAEGNGTFILAFRGANYHAGFVDRTISMERFTDDLFGGGVQIEQRRIAGQAYEANGSIDETP